MAEKNYAIFSIVFTIISMVLLLGGAVWLTILFMTSSTLSWIPILFIVISIIFFIIGMIIMMLFYTTESKEILAETEKENLILLEEQY